MKLLKIGLDVPWNTPWTGEAEFEVRPCRWAYGRRAVWQRFSPGRGRPDFARPHIVRQRRSVIEMLCTVCGRPTVESDRWSFRMGYWRMVGARPALCTTEAPVHRACADLAGQACPNIRRQGLEPIRFPLTYRRVLQMVSGAAVQEDFGLTIRPDQPVVGHVYLVLPDAWARDHFGDPDLAAVAAAELSMKAACA